MHRILAGFLLIPALLAPLGAEEPPAPAITNLSISATQTRLNWSPYPAAEQYQVLSTSDLGLLFSTNFSGSITGFLWTAATPPSSQFYRLSVTPLNSERLLAATVLNRLAYGPTPDDLRDLATNGAQSYIDRQVAPESITEVSYNFITETNNGNTWVYVTQSGTASSSTFYLYLDDPGTVFIDDLKLVRGSVPEAGVNVIQNGDFESPLTGPWQVTSNFFNSQINSNIFHGGNASLQLTATADGGGSGNSVYQLITPALVAGQVYTVSYWYLPSTNRATLIARLSGSGIDSRPERSPAGLLRRLEARRATITDLRAWLCLNAVGAKRQLLEVLTQFLENHFVTQYSKSRDYFDQFYDDGTIMDTLATDLEFREVSAWRQALLRPNCTFYDLLQISAESPAQIIYLDTVGSRGDGTRIANENYARELLELFTFGVDNGYDQNDITVMSRAWTGWTLRLVDETNINNRYAPQSTTIIPGSTNTSISTISNLLGVWSFVYRQDRHNNSNKVMFANRTVPARFGPPWAGRNYQLTLPARSGNGSIADGYDSIRHLADQPFTQEFISVKFCRLFVHDDFEHGVYDFRDTNNLSPEAALVRQCMLAWENSTPKGQIRPILHTIFNSELFRSHGGSLQKVKTPLEYVVSSVRALRSTNGSGGFTANTDGYALFNPMDRMGRMRLFDRAEPDGYPESAPGWISAGTLAERVRYVQSLLLHAADGRKSDGGTANQTDPVALVRQNLPSGSWNNAGAVADYFLGVLYPAEGKANLDLYRRAAVYYLNRSENGLVDSPFASLSTGGTPSPYEIRLRAMVSMLMAMQRFQEQ